MTGVGLGGTGSTAIVKHSVEEEPRVTDAAMARARAFFFLLSLLIRFCFFLGEAGPQGLLAGGGVAISCLEYFFTRLVLSSTLTGKSSYRCSWRFEVIHNFMLLNWLRFCLGQKVKSRLVKHHFLC